MQKEIPLTIERLSEEQEKACRIIAARQILSLLQHIAQNGLRVVLYYNDGRDFIITSLLDVDEDGLWVEQGADPEKNPRIANSNIFTVVSSLDRVKIQFSVTGVQAVTYQGYPAFFLPIPKSLFRIQRRENYRLVLPLSVNMRCVVPINKPKVGDKIEVQVMDISGGGVRLFAEGDFAPGQNYSGCQINLPEVGVINFTMTVRNLVTITLKPGQTVKRVGCEFKHLDNTSGVLLQRYVTKMQRLKSND